MADSKLRQHKDYIDMSYYVHTKYAQHILQKLKNLRQEYIDSNTIRQKDIKYSLSSKPLSMHKSHISAQGDNHSKELKVKIETELKNAWAKQKLMRKSNTPSQSRYRNRGHSSGYTLNAQTQQKDFYRKQQSHNLTRMDIIEHHSEIVENKIIEKRILKEMKNKELELERKHMLDRLNSTMESNQKKTYEIKRVNKLRQCINKIKWAQGYENVKRALRAQEFEREQLKKKVEEKNQRGEQIKDYLSSQKKLVQMKRKMERIKRYQALQNFEKLKMNNSVNV